MQRRESLKSRLWQISLATVLLHVPIVAAHAVTCDVSEFSCSPGVPCTIVGSWQIGDECVLDFGEASVTLQGTLQAASVGGGFVIRARDLTLWGGKLKSVGTSDVTGGAIDVVLGGTFVMDGTGPLVDVGGGGGGGVVDIAASSIEIRKGVISANGGTGDNCGDAGQINLNATTGALSVAATIRSTTPGGPCIGGELALAGSAVAISGTIDASGGAGASEDAITIRATDGAVSVSGSAAVRADGTGQPDGFGSDGGRVSNCRVSEWRAITGGRAHLRNRQSSRRRRGRDLAARQRCD